MGSARGFRRTWPPAARRAGLAAFTLIELLLVVAVLALLLTLLVPSMREARLLAKRAVCATSQRCIGTAARAYAVDWPAYVPVYLHNRTDPPLFKDWRIMLLPYAGDPSLAVFHCPGSRQQDWTDVDRPSNRGSFGVMFTQPYSYTFYDEADARWDIAWPGKWPVWPLKPNTAWKDPANSTYVADAYLSFDPIRYPSVEKPGGGNTNHIHAPCNQYGVSGVYLSGTGGTRRFADRHKGTNLLWLDGHVESRRTEDLDTMAWGAPGTIWDTQ